MLDGVLWLLRSGAPWQYMAECFGPWRTVYHRFRVWRNQGTFDRMLKRLHLKLNDQGITGCTSMSALLFLLNADITTS